MATHAATGATPDGVPLSFNRAPADDLEPWIGRAMVAIINLPDDTVSLGQLCNDCCYMRTAIDGEWIAHPEGGQITLRNQTFLTGQNAFVMPLECTGSIHVGGLMMRPGAVKALFGVNDGELTNRIRRLEDIGDGRWGVTGLHDNKRDPASWLDRMEEWVRRRLAQTGAPEPDQISLNLERAAFENPNLTQEEFAARQNVGERTIQRTVKRDYGLTFKQVMRRARILDLASRLCGVADEEEEEEFHLRFFDQSHLIREFTAFFKLTPKRFAAERNALLTLSLEIRQARRLEMLDRLSPSNVRPWMKRPFSPPVRRKAA